MTQTKTIVLSPVAKPAINIRHKKKDYNLPTSYVLPNNIQV
jgi:hypothetical protein